MAAHRKSIHPKVKATASIAGVLLTVDALIVAVEGSIPSPAVVGVLAGLHAILPPLAGYLKRV